MFSGFLAIVGFKRPRKTPRGFQIRLHLIRQRGLAEEVIKSKTTG